MNKQELIKYFKDLPYVSVSQMGKKSFIDMIEQLDEPQKPVVPQFVADWIDYCKENHLTITGAFDPVSENGIGLAETFKGNAYKCTRWALDNQDLFARAWLDGYEVEKEKYYKIEVKRVSENSTLIHDITEECWFFEDDNNEDPIQTYHTRKELEEAGFGWVFDCEGIEAKEVE